MVVAAWCFPVSFFNSTALENVPDDSFVEQQIFQPCTKCRLLFTQTKAVMLKLHYCGFTANCGAINTFCPMKNACDSETADWLLPAVGKQILSELNLR